MNAKKVLSDTNKKIEGFLMLLKHKNLLFLPEIMIF